ncbi:hypothetical protein, conserved [Plasmodium gonderi]|uniref:Asparagine-rich protein n=1 Tax=Plasmodium gonderi TaxID=77519 RepID=A0A1Y1JUW4_PLAGO|nr:hypothetical protein, conserved [Plasmodium gonderi]GAW83694.1 hypothetical protein, conserved [Plasmodium gonderi]
MKEVQQEVSAREDDYKGQKPNPEELKSDAAIIGNGKEGEGSATTTATTTAAAANSSGGGYLFNLLDRFNNLTKAKPKTEQDESGNAKELDKSKGMDMNNEVRKGKEDEHCDFVQKVEGNDLIVKTESDNDNKEDKKSSIENPECVEIVEDVENMESMEKSDQMNNEQDDIKEEISESIPSNEVTKTNRKNHHEGKEKLKNSSTPTETDCDTFNENGKNVMKCSSSDHEDYERVESDRVESDRVESDRVESDRVEYDRVESDGENGKYDELAKAEELIKEIKENEEVHSDEMSNDMLLLYAELYNCLFDRLDCEELGNKEKTQILKKEIEKFRENQNIMLDYLGRYKNEVKSILLSMNDSSLVNNNVNINGNIIANDNEENEKRESQNLDQVSQQLNRRDGAMLSEIKSSFYQMMEQKLNGYDYDNNEIEENLMYNRNLNMFFLLMCRKHIIHFLEEIFSAIHVMLVEKEKLEEEMSALLKRMNRINIFMHLLIKTNERNGGNASTKHDCLKGSYIYDDQGSHNDVSNKIRMDTENNKNYINGKCRTEEVLENNTEKQHHQQYYSQQNHSQQYHSQQNHSQQYHPQQYYGQHHHQQYHIQQYHHQHHRQHYHHDTSNRTNFSPLNHGVNRLNKVNKMNLNKKTSNYFRKDNNETQVSLSTGLTEVSIVDKKVRDRNSKKKILSNENSSSNSTLVLNDKGVPKKISCENSTHGVGNGNANGTGLTNDYFSDMMVYISWVPKSARCQYPLELPKNSAERNKLAEYIEAKEQMLYILKLMGYEEIDNIYFHPPKGSHIKIKFKTLACMNKFLKTYKNTPDKWKEDMFNFFNIPLRSSISVRDLRIERAVPRSSAAEFKKIKKINKNYHDLFLFKDNYHLCEDGNNNNISKLENVNIHYDSLNKHIVMHTKGAATATASVAMADDYHGNGNNSNNKKANNDHRKNISKMKGIIGSISVNENASEEVAHVLVDENSSTPLNNFSTLCKGNMSTAVEGGSNGAISVGTLGRLGSSSVIERNGSATNGIGNGEMMNVSSSANNNLINDTDNGINHDAHVDHHPHHQPLSGHDNISNALTTKTTAVIMSNGILKQVSNNSSSANMLHGIYPNGKSNTNNIRNGGRTFLTSNHMGSGGVGFVPGVNGMGSSSSMSGYYGNYVSNQMGNQMRSHLNSETLNHFDGGSMRNGCISKNIVGNDKLNYTINHNNTMYSSRNSSRNIYLMKNKNLNNKTVCAGDEVDTIGSGRGIGIGSSTSGGGGGGGRRNSFLSNSNFLSSSSSNNGMNTINKDNILNNVSYNFKKQTHYASFSNASNNNMNSHNEHLFSFNSSGGSTANVNGSNSALCSNNHGNGNLIISTFNNTQHSNNHSNNSSTRGTQNGTTNLNHFGTSSHLDVAGSSKEKNLMRGFKSCHLGIGTAGEMNASMGSFGVGSLKLQNDFCSGNNSVNNNNSGSNNGNTYSYGDDKFCTDVINQNYGTQNDDMKEDFKNLINIDFINDIDMDFDEKSNEELSMSSVCEYGNHGDGNKNGNVSGNGSGNGNDNNDENNNGNSNGNGNSKALSRNFNHLHQQANNVKRLNPLESCMSEGLLSASGATCVGNCAGNCMGSSCVGSRNGSSSIKAREYEQFDKFDKLDKFDKFDEFDKFDKFDKYDEFEKFDKYNKFETYDNIYKDMSYRMNNEEEELNANEEMNLNQNEFAYSNIGLNNINKVGSVCRGGSVDRSGIMISEGYNNNYFSEEKAKNIFPYYDNGRNGIAEAPTTSNGSNNNVYVNMGIKGKNTNNSNSLNVENAPMNNNYSTLIEHAENGMNNSLENSVGNSSSSLYRNTLNPNLYIDGIPFNNAYGKYDGNNFCESKKDDKVKAAEYDLKMNEEEENKSFLGYSFQTSRVDKEKSFSDNYVNFF